MEDIVNNVERMIRRSKQLRSEPNKQVRYHLFVIHIYVVFKLCIILEELPPENCRAVVTDMGCSRQFPRGGFHITLSLQHVQGKKNNKS